VSESDFTSECSPGQFNIFGAVEEKARLLSSRISPLDQWLNPRISHRRTAGDSIFVSHRPQILIQWAPRFSTISAQETLKATESVEDSSETI
jgi:hypothetical protein